MSAPETPGETAEKARVRRRWLTLGEGLAVFAAVVSGLTLWFNWSDRRNAEVREVRTEAKARAAAASIALGAGVEDEGRRLALTSLRADQSIQAQTLAFPPSLGLAAVETTGSPRIEADWLRDALRKAEKDNGGDRASDRRLPVLIVTRFWSDGAMHEARGLYDLGYALEDGGLLGGRRLRLTGLSYIGAADAKAGSARLDRLWASRR